MDMIQQLFVVAFVAFVFSILVEKLACVTINGEEWKPKRSKDNCSKGESMRKSKKKVRFAVHDQIAIVINNKLIKLGSVKRLPTKNQLFRPISYDLIEPYLAGNWIGEELMVYKELGLYVEPHELRFRGIQDLRLIFNDEAKTGFVIDQNIDDQIEVVKNENSTLDFAPKNFY